ncbi:hypothetical protein KUTeg_023414, partial [Tegillarca granosa]
MKPPHYIDAFISCYYEASTLYWCLHVDTMKPPHYIGAFMCFIIGVVYCWLQTVITCKTRPVKISQKINKSNLCLRIFQMLVCFVSTSVLIYNVLVFATRYFVFVTHLLIVVVILCFLNMKVCVTKAMYKFQKKKQLGSKW